MTDTEVTAPKEKTERTPEQEAQHHATRAIARALATLEEGTAEEQKTRRTENKAKYAADARKLVKALTREGVAFTYDEASSAKSKRAAKKASKAEGEGSAED